MKVIDYIEQEIKEMENSNWFSVILKKRPYEALEFINILRRIGKADYKNGYCNRIAELEARMTKRNKLIKKLKLKLNGVIDNNK